MCFDDRLGESEAAQPQTRAQFRLVDPEYRLAAHSLTEQGAFRKRTSARLPRLGPHLAHARSPAQSPIFVAFIVVIVAVHIVVGGRSPHVHSTEKQQSRPPARTHARWLCTHTACRCLLEQGMSASLVASALPSPARLWSLQRSRAKTDLSGPGAR